MKDYLDLSNRDIIAVIENTVKYITRNISNYLTRDDSILSKEAIEIFSNKEDKEKLLKVIYELSQNKEGKEKKEKTIELSNKEKISITM